jgi:hypothetical protein
VSGILESIVDAAGNAVDAIGNVVDAIGNIPGAGVVGDLLGGLPGLEAGGIITQPTIAMLGEKAKEEVVLPLTDPKRTLELAHQSGLFGVLARAGAFDGSVPATAAAHGAVVGAAAGATIINLEAHFGTVPNARDARAAGREMGRGVAEVLDKRHARVTAQIAS